MAPGRLPLPHEAPYAQDGPALGDTPSRTSTGSKSTLPEVIENLGTGLAQVRTGLLAGPVWFADGAELILISSVTDVVAAEWGFSPAQKGAVVTFVYMGVLVGNLLSGPFGDNFGRRLPILLSFLFIFICSMFSALAWGFWSLGLFRFLVGVSIGIGQPAQQALVSETTPTKWRIVFTSVGMFLFAMGEVYSGFLLLADDPQLLDLHWRTMLIAGAVPSVVFGLLAFAFLNQSPLFLACGGRYEETQEILESMRKDNSAPGVSIDFKPHRVLCGGSGAQSNLSRMLGIIFGGEHLVTTCVLVLSCFVLNLSYYGSLYAFPIVLSQGVDIGSSPALGLVYGGLLENIGYIVGIVCILYFPRITVMRSYVLVMGLALMLFAVFAPQNGPGAHIGAMFGYYGTKFTVSIGFLVFYLYTSEVYPTSVRATGTAVVFAGGRIAAMASPLIYEYIASAFHFAAFFWLMALFNGANFFCTSFLQVETFGKVMKDEEDAVEDIVEDGAPEYGSTQHERGRSG